MKNRLPIVLFILLFACGLLGGLPSAQASHLLGCDMTYTSLGNNQYRVKFRLYRDCSGIQASPFVLECRNGGCNATATVTAPLVQQGPTVTANPLGPNTPGTCASPSALYPLYDFTTYEATVTLPPGQWTMSTSQGSRPTIANIVGSPDLYAEAFLDNRSSGSTTVANTSPQFDPQDIPIQYSCVNQLNSLGFSSIEPDGDSLVYALVAPLGACGTLISYAPYLNQPAPVLISSNPVCLFSPVASGSNNFSPTLPLPVALDTTGSCPLLTGRPRFRLNQTARTITFMPNVYTPATSAADGRNKYQVVVEVTEYRRINGVRRVVGRVRREAVVIVIDCGANNVPRPVVAVARTINSGTSTYNSVDSTQINVASCSFSRVSLNFTDPDNLRTPSAHQLLTVTLPADINTNSQLLSSGDIGSFSITGNGTENPVGTLYFQPSPSMVGRLIRLNFRVEDNAAPVKGVQTRVVVVRVVRNNAASLVTAGVAGGGSADLCAGGTLVLQANAMRPDSVRRLSNNTTVPQTYAYLWTVRGDGLNQAQATSATISVAPTRTSRYSLTVSPLTGFGTSCSDTTSVLVRVLPAAAAPVVTRNGLVLTSSYATGNQWYRDGLPIAGATARTLTVTANGSYSVQTLVAGSALGSCLSPFSAAQTVLSAQQALAGASLSVAPNPTPDGRLSVVLTGYRLPVELTVLDALGRTVGHAAIASPNPQGTAQALDLTGVGPGVYVLQVRTAASLETRRIVRE
ncbi:T9SS type A sorting domain-containing protein [Hymenobacter negativus]|uniref:T9SS type A sorting domain-containing protein n=1 Tax=Hymenobacter negativus TaxID=2795026 RepID=A0ABS0Q975_9BACT|nr:T9SS type A sorting domain-containing protein [Hymenobacter negativus]MBH8559228.1 T9SS type A sorting domain-containing protein [Hymenobacter negativus]